MDEPVVGQFLFIAQRMGQARPIGLGLPGGEPDGGLVALEGWHGLVVDGQGGLSLPLRGKWCGLALFLRVA